MMNNNRNTNNNPYGHLLDKYLEPERLDRETKRQREEEAQRRYGNLLDKAKPDYSTLELMEKMEEGRLERRKREEEERKISALRMQERAAAAKRREERHNAEVRDYAESLIERKRAQIKAAEKAEEERRMEAQRQEDFNRNIEGLARINPELAEGYLEILKKHNIL